MTTPNNTVAGLAEKLQSVIDEMNAAADHAQAHGGNLSWRYPREWATTLSALASPAASVSPSVAGDAGERLNEAAENVGHITFESMRQCADSWLALNDLLNELAPGWTNNTMTGRESALATIRRLATAEQPGSAVQGENREQEAAALGNILRRFSAELSLHEKASLTIAVQILGGTTPPPEPAAEQGHEATCDCPRDHRGQHIYACPERPLAFGLHDPAAAFNQPEARGVEGIVVTDEMLNAGQEALCALTNFTHWDDEHQAAIYRAMLAAAPSGVRVDDAARALVRKIEAIHADPGYQSVWFCAHNHGQPYTGPNYEAELAALSAALAGKEGA